MLGGGEGLSDLSLSSSDRYSKAETGFWVVSSGAEGKKQANQKTARAEANEKSENEKKMAILISGFIISSTSMCSGIAFFYFNNNDNGQ